MTRRKKPPDETEGERTVKKMKKILAALAALVMALAACGTAAAEQEARKIESAADAEEWVAAFLGEHPEEMDGVWAMAPMICSGVKRSSRAARSKSPSRLLRRRPSGARSRGTWQYSGAGLPSRENRYVCRGVEASRSRPRTTCVTPLSASSTTTAS